MDVLMGALGPLIRKLYRLVEDEYAVQTGVEKQIYDLHKELEVMQAALLDLAKKEPAKPDDATIIWANEVRDLSYEAEDIIEDFFDDQSDSSLDGLIPMLSNLSISMYKRHDIHGAIEAVKERAEALSDRHKRLKVDPTPVQSTFDDPRVPFLFQDRNTLVGIKGSRDTVIKKLQKPQIPGQNLKIVSIVGIGGLGKTTLAQEVYHRMGRGYDTKAFVSVSQKPSLKKVFWDILTQVDEEQCKDYDSTDKAVFMGRLQTILGKKRYLIVIDDIWDTPSWDEIKVILVNRKHQNRVVTTTRNRKVGEYTGDVYDLEPLSDTLSEQLFNTTFFKGNIPSVVDERPQELLNKCGGVPLAIITMASLLVRKLPGDWPSVYNKIGFGNDHQSSANNKVESTRTILLFSYYDLPHYLRTCLLHLNMYPEDYSIPKETLIWKWVAEGFIHEEAGKGLFEIGERYFRELIARNVIMPVEDKARPYIITGCRLHDLVLDMIHGLSAELNFVTIADSTEEPKHSLVRGVDRRLAVQMRSAGQTDPLANRSTEKLRSFHATDYHFERGLRLGSFVVLRVLALENCTFLEGHPYSLKHLGKLRRLRYLGLYETPIDKLPKKIGKLKYLLILDLRGTTVKELPKKVAQLTQLKCLRADASTAVPDWMGNYTSLEELRLDEVGNSVNFVNELGKLTELRELEIWVENFDEKKNRALVQSLNNLGKIQLLRLKGESPSAYVADWASYVPPKELRELHIENAFSRLPEWINFSSVPLLSYLHLEVKSMEEQDMVHLGMLPELVSLKLLMPSNIFPTINTTSSFAKLRCLDMSTAFQFRGRAMQNLESLHFKVDVRAMRDANITDESVALALGNLPSLQKVKVQISKKGARDLSLKEAKRALKSAVKVHPNKPTIKFRPTDK